MGVKECEHISAPGLDDDVDLDVLFTNFYRANHWGSGETRSGPGSERARTREVVRDLSKLVRELGIQSMLDAPCGDFNWMQDVSLEGIDYTGCDIVEDLVESNSVQYGGRSRTFKRLDLTVDPLPRVDLILCRDALVHFSYDHAFAALRNFRASKSTYLLTTTFPKIKKNKNIETGDWRQINLQLPPFGLPEPEHEAVVPDEADEGKVLALWKLQELPR